MRTISRGSHDKLQQLRDASVRSLTHQFHGAAK
jgi:hypothetical protein